MLTVKEYAMPNNVLVVAGMHRSGTSLISHWLHDCGLQIGESLLEGGKGNEEGHFEDLEFLKMHEEILTRKGCDAAGLHAPFDVVPTPYEKAKMQAIISVKNTCFTQWGWKEPRTCLFLSTYTELLPNAKYLVVLRSYQDVVHSLIRRDLAHIEERYRARGPLHRWFWRHIARPGRLRRHRQKHAERYLQAWLTYNEKILEALDGLPESHYLVVSYQMMRQRSDEVFRFLSSHWRFRLHYENFATVFKNELISKQSDGLPVLANEALLQRANGVGAALQGYLERSMARLAGIPASAARQFERA
jgi:hypothetical protein